MLDCLAGSFVVNRAFSCWIFTSAASNMTSDVLSIQERVDLMKLAKALAVKSAQIIIQSRDGSKAYTKCNPNKYGQSTVSKRY